MFIFLTHKSRVLGIYQYEPQMQTHWRSAGIYIIGRYYLKYNLYNGQKIKLPINLYVLTSINKGLEISMVIPMIDSFKDNEMRKDLHLM